jgi:hypothetical protein
MELYIPYYIVMSGKLEYYFVLTVYILLIFFTFLMVLMALIAATPIAFSFFLAAERTIIYMI